MWDCTFRKTIAWNTTILDWFSPIKNIYLRNCFIKTVHTHLSHLYAWLILQLPLKSVVQGLESFFEEAFVLILGRGVNNDVFDEPGPLSVETDLLVELLL